MYIAPGAPQALHDSGKKCSFVFVLLVSLLLLVILKMYHCKACSNRSRSMKDYVEHYRLHFNEANIYFPCAVRGCIRKFRTFSAFKSHVSRDHQTSGGDKRHKPKSPVVDVTIKCPFSFCFQVLPNIKDMIGHLKEHIAQGVEITCPFQGCNSSFKIKSSFSSHVSRRHQGVDSRVITPELLISSQENQNFVSNSIEFGEDGSSEIDEQSMSCGNDESNTTDLFVKNLALFYLKLNAKYHVPSSTVQKIIEEMQAMHNISQNLLQQRIRRKLTELDVEKRVVDHVVQDFISNDIYNSVHSENGTLSTDFRRKQFYKHNFRYVAPVTINLGFDKNKIKRYCEYVPIIETIQELLKDPSVKAQYNNPNCVSSDNVLRDFTDGSVARENLLFIELDNAIKLILYQDAFEVVNPLGSAKRKHKILAVYVILGNIYRQNRSKIDQMQLVLLVREINFKYFGQEAVFRVLVDDLKKIEQIGILVDDKLVRGTVAMITGDNLGSHCIGGFVENFSGCIFVCRYCLFRTDEIEDGNIHDTYCARSPDNYQNDLHCLGNHPDKNNIHGVKFNSIFNELLHFHVCNPGLPPCLGHDLFEGVVNYDLALFINYMIKVKKWFTYVQLNHYITKFKYCGLDCNNKPSTISDLQGQKLGGHAVQNWCLLRLLPVLIASKVDDTNDPVWHEVLLLREIVQFVCAPEISVAQVAYLKVLIEEYLDERITLFPDKKVRPKHHFVAHYPGLIMQFGPLIRVWTLRFESKHSYFKKCARNSQNFINICHTFAERHQLFQAYLSNGSLFDTAAHLDNAIPFSEDLYNDSIKDAFLRHHVSVDDVLTSCSCNINGVQYKKDLFVVVENNESSLIFGKIVMLFQHKDSSVCILVKKTQASYNFDMGFYQVEGDMAGPFTCIKFSDLKSSCCLPSYRVNNGEVVVLQHSIVT